MCISHERGIFTLQSLALSIERGLLFDLRPQFIRLCSRCLCAHGLLFCTLSPLDCCVHAPLDRVPKNWLMFAGQLINHDILVATWISAAIGCFAFAFRDSESAGKVNAAWTRWGFVARAEQRLDRHRLAGHGHLYLATLDPPVRQAVAPALGQRTVAVCGDCPALVRIGATEIPRLF